MAVRTDGSAPYAPPATVIQVVDRFRSHGLQAPLTKDVLIRAGVTESLVPRTLQALSLLDLIDEDGKPTADLEALARASHDEYQGTLAEIVRAAYADVFKFTDPAQDSFEGVQDAFRGYSPRGQHSRMVTLFLGLCETAGIIEKLPEKTNRRSAGRATGQPRRGARGSSGASGSPATRDIRGLHPALAGLLTSLPPKGETWTSAQRDRFVETFESVLDYAVQVSDEQEAVGDDS